MRRSAHFFLILVLIGFGVFSSEKARALEYSYGSLHATVEPIVGFEWAPKSDPSQHLHGRLVYGARVSGGAPYLSLEGEYTHATDEEAFASGESIRDTDDRLKLGLRSGYQFNPFLEGHLRGGAQAEKNLHEVTQGGVTSSTSNPIDVRPYAGLGFRATLTSRTYATIDLTVTFHDLNDLRKNEYQTTTGIAVQFP